MARLAERDRRKAAAERGEAEPKKPKTAPPLLWPENALAWEIFEAVRTQLIAVAGLGMVAIGIQHAAIELQFDLRGVPQDERLAMFERVQLIERYYVAKLNRGDGRSGKGSHDPAAHQGRRHRRA